MSNWLPLTEYSTKYGVSISTLRRRIRTDEIRFVLEDGKYFLSDEPIKKNHRPSLVSDKTNESKTSLMGSQSAPQKAALAVKEIFQKPREEFVEEKISQTVPQLQYSQPSQQMDEPILTAANRLLSELKKAYTQILQEKEEQIMFLKEEDPLCNVRLYQ